MGRSSCQDLGQDPGNGRGDPREKHRCCPDPEVSVSRGLIGALSLAVTKHNEDTDVLFMPHLFCS